MNAGWLTVLYMQTVLPAAVLDLVFYDFLIYFSDCHETNSVDPSLVLISVMSEEGSGETDDSSTKVLGQCPSLGYVK